MIQTLTFQDAIGEAITPSMFGGNVVAHKAPMTGEASYATAIDSLGATSLRFPGGSVTEYTFDLTNPDAEIVTDARTGKEVDFIPLSDFMSYAAETGHSVVIVLPTRTELGEATDDNGDRLPSFDEDILRGFVRDVVSGKYGAAQVDAFEVGNEYWGSGEMNSAEYGRLAADMTRVIDDELAQLESLVPGASDVDVVVQMGANYGSSDLSALYGGMNADDILADLNEVYGMDLGQEVVFPNGTLNWTQINNQIVLTRFDDDAMEAVDGVVTHVYTFADASPSSRTFALKQIQDSWEEAKPDIDIYVTEWNQKMGARFDSSDDFGLYQAHELLEITEEFAIADVDQAHVWPLVLNSMNTFSYIPSAGVTTPAGEMFSMMSENLPGMTLLDLNPSADHTESAESDVEVHGFAGQGDVLLYIYSKSHDGAIQRDIDIAGLVESYGAVDAQILGVAEGELAGSNRSEPVIEKLTEAEVIEDGMVSVTLDPGEILQLRLIDVTPTEALSMVLAEGDAAPAPVVTELDLLPTQDTDIGLQHLEQDQTTYQDEEQAEQTRDTDDETSSSLAEDLGGMAEGVGLALGALLLALIGMGGF